MEQKIQAKKVITCPHCGWEYLPAEVVYPTQVVGQPIAKTIIRDPLGKILFYEWRENDTPLSEESFICDNCNRPFIVEIDPIFKTKKQEEALDFSTSYASLI